MCVKERRTSLMKSSMFSLDLPWKVVTVGCLIDRENDISAGIGFRSGSVACGSSSGRGSANAESDEKSESVGDEDWDVDGAGSVEGLGPTDLWFLALERVSSTGDEMRVRTRPMRRPIDLLVSVSWC